MAVPRGRGVAAAARCMRKISIVIPVLNEAPGIVTLLTHLQSWRAAGHELILVDGGSTDGTRERGAPWVDQVLSAARGRALQMNVGAAASTGEILLFLHADTALPAEAATLLTTIAAQNSDFWGRFDVRLSGAGTGYRIIETLMNLRSRLTGIATGDQAMFVSRAWFEQVGGFPSIALMEDIALSARLKRRARPLCLSIRVITSSRRWEHRGMVRTLFEMWGLRLLFACGVNPSLLARCYRHIR